MAGEKAGEHIAASRRTVSRPSGTSWMSLGWLARVMVNPVLRSNPRPVRVRPFGFSWLGGSIEDCRAVPCYPTAAGDRRSEAHDSVGVVLPSAVGRRWGACVVGGSAHAVPADAPVTSSRCCLCTSGPGIPEARPAIEAKAARASRARPRVARDPSNGSGAGASPMGGAGRPAAERR